MDMEGFMAKGHFNLFPLFGNQVYFETGECQSDLIKKQHASPSNERLRQVYDPFQQDRSV
jgi:hypothetical protein